MSRTRFKSTFDISEKGNISHHGYLYKRGQINKSWQKRWFVLYDNNYLCYYEHPEDTNETPLGDIILYKFTEIKAAVDKKNKNKKSDSKDFIFEIVSSKRSFLIKCNNSNDYNAWFNKMKQIIQPNILHKGWITKQGAIHQTWKKRYFLLTNYSNRYELRYYENERLKKFKGVINCILINKIDIVLPEISSTKYGDKKDKILELITLTRTWVLNFNNANDRNMWHKSIKNAVHQSRKSKNSKFKYDEKKLNQIDDMLDEIEENENVKTNNKLNK